MKQEGPILESLTRRLAETPEDFLAEPRVGRVGTVETAAVVGDMLERLGCNVRPEQLALVLTGNRPARAVSQSDLPGMPDLGYERNRQAVTLILCWLLADDWFRQNKSRTENLLQLLCSDAAEVASEVVARKCVTDPDRREELARIALARLGYRPAGETPAQAQDRLTTLSSAERARVMQAARAAEERARQIREALARKAAQESADKWTRE